MTVNKEEAKSASVSSSGKWMGQKNSVEARECFSSAWWEKDCFQNQHNRCSHEVEASFLSIFFLPVSQAPRHAEGQLLFLSPRWTVHHIHGHHFIASLHSYTSHRFRQSLRITHMQFATKCILRYTGSGSACAGAPCWCHGKYISNNRGAFFSPQHEGHVGNNSFTSTKQCFQLGLFKEELGY